MPVFVFLIVYWDLLGSILILERYQLRISVRPFTSGRGTVTCMSNLPGLTSALNTKSQVAFTETNTS